MNQEINNIDSWRTLGFFKGQDHLTFTFKKAEKITAALYLVSSLLKDNEPLKWEIREKAVSLISTTIALNSIEPSDKNALLQALFSVFLETLTLLNISLLAGLVSEMNYSVLKKEIDQVVALLKEKVTEDTARAGYILSDSFFRTDFKPDSNSQGQLSLNNTNNVLEGLHKSNENKGKREKMPVIKDKKDDRKTIITDLLRKQSNLTIKDFARVISGCSEKTIQRELLDLVQKGIVKKEGERRWSTYSLI